MFMLYFKLFTLIINLLVAATATRFFIEGECKNKKEIVVCLAFLIPNLLYATCMFLSLIYE